MAKLPPIQQLKGRALGRILIKMGILTREKVHECVKIQQERGGKVKIGQIFKELDKDAIWQTDSWDFQAVPSLWTPDRIKNWFDHLPKEMMTIYDTAGIINPQYKKTNYFEGAKWTLGILHSFQGEDHLHGNLKRAFNAIQELSADPRADKCEGIYHVPEISGHNVLYFDLTTNLAWNPDNYPGVDNYLDEYTRRRFGETDFANMRQAIAFLTAAVYGNSRETNGQMPIYQKLGCSYSTGQWPIMGTNVAHPAEKGKGIQLLFHAVNNALACRQSQAQWLTELLQTRHISMISQGELRPGDNRISPLDDRLRPLGFWVDGVTNVTHHHAVVLDEAKVVVPHPPTVIVTPEILPRPQPDRGLIGPGAERNLIVPPVRHPGPAEVDA